MTNDYRLLKLAEKATPEWKCSSQRNDSIVSEQPLPHYRDKETYEWYGGFPIAESMTKENRDYVLAAANCLPDLVRRIQALRDVLEAITSDCPQGHVEMAERALHEDTAAEAGMKIIEQ